MLRKRLEKASKASYNLSIDGSPITADKCNNNSKTKTTNSNNNNTDGKNSISLDNNQSPTVTLQYWNPDQVKSSSNKNGVRLQELLDLFEANMGEQYRNSSWGLDMDEKKMELSHDKARFLVLLDAEAHQKVNSGKKEDDGDASTSSVVKDMVGFCHYRFEYDDEDSPCEPVLYVYELQVSESHWRQGLGKRAMIHLEEMAKSMDIAKVMLTVFRSNAQAMDFYQCMHYEVDEISPSKHGDIVDYEILSKRV